MNKLACRPREHLQAASRLYPQAWQDIERMRTDLRGTAVPDWPEWCYIPIAGAQAAVANDAGIDVSMLGVRYPERIPDAARLAGLAAWRMTQGIYRFDPAVYDAVRDTPLSGDIPHEVLYHMPEWAVYIETPDAHAGDQRMHGALAHLEHDVHTQRPELRLLLDLGEGDHAALLPVPIHLGPWTLSEGIARAIDIMSAASMSRGGMALPRTVMDGLRTAVESALSLLLYVCSQRGAVSGVHGQPGNPQPRQTRRHGLKLFPAESPRTWDVGVRMGVALRAAYHAEQTGAPGSHSGPRPHVRRAHWHTILSGPRKRADGSEITPDERIRDLRWMPPIPVNVDDVGDLPAVVRPVR